MATILPFRHAEPVGEVVPKPRRAEGSVAEIIIFPGVRIERRIKAADESSETTPGQRRPAQGE